MKNILITYFLLLSFAFNFSPTSMGKNGVVTSSSSYASDIGIQVLKQGGNAVDAAVAVGFALSVTFPNAGNIGGGGFMVIRLSDGTTKAIDFREVAPLLASRDMFLDDSSNVIQGSSLYTALASGVPGTVAGLEFAHKKYGSMPWSQLVEPSIYLALNGFKLADRDAEYLNRARRFLSRDTETSKIFTSTRKFKSGDLLVQKDLGETLSRISIHGANDFYRGETSRLIARCMDRTGGIISREDLINYKPIERQPIEFYYRGHKVISMPPASSGGICLAQILNQIEMFNINELPHHGPQHLQLMIEAQRRAYADRAEFMGDSDFIDIPIDHLISDDYAHSRFSTFTFNEPTLSKDIGAGDVNKVLESEETTHYSIVDKWGNAVSVTTTLNGKYGNGIVVDGAGFLLNNEMDDFSIKPGHPNLYGLVGNEANSISPKKRMLSSMTPTIVENVDGELLLVLGSPGGSTIITTVAQLIVNVVDFKMDINKAVNTPRFHHQWLPDLVFFETNFTRSTAIDELETFGYEIKYRGAIGEANCIQVHPSGVMFGAADLRRKATAKAY